MNNGPKKDNKPTKLAFSLDQWMETSSPDDDNENLVLLRERKGGRSLVEKALQETVKDHLADLGVISRIKGYKKSLAFIRAKMPRPSRVRSGDCAEILATEYIEQCTDYRVPIQRLRWKDDRDTAMRGDDVIAIRKAHTRWHVLKAESKSRATLTPSVVREAIAGLSRNAGRPNPSSLAFIASRLRELRRNEEADVFIDLQERSPRRGEVEHLVFTLSGNNPTTQLQQNLADDAAACRRLLVGCVIKDHAAFIEGLFDGICKP